MGLNSVRFAKAISILVIAGLTSGCLETEGAGSTNDGLKPVNGTLGGQMFLRYCYNSPDGTVISRDPAFKREPVRNAPKMQLFIHQSLLTLYTAEFPGTCQMDFQGSELRVTSVAAAARVIASATGGKVSYDPNGNPLNIETKKGWVYFYDTGIVRVGPPVQPNRFRYVIRFGPDER